jgi:5-methylcytosine-specific restriction enzyme B
MDIFALSERNMGGLIMNIEDIKSKILKDPFLDIAVKEYINFINTKEHDENYKFEILTKANDFIKSTTITPFNILDVIKYFSSNNPQQGSFVHWSNLDDLKKYAVDKPEEVSASFNELYNESLPLLDRISSFYNKGKLYNSSINLGTPLFAYLLAGCNLGKYPLYKDEIFRDFLKTFNINEPMNDIAMKYDFYYKVCSILLSNFKERNIFDNPTMMEVQDFIYCISQYPELTVKVSTSYIYTHSVRLHGYEQDVESLLKYITTLDRSYLEKIAEKYKSSDKVKKVRYLVAERVLNDNEITLEQLEAIKVEVDNSNSKDIFRAWNNFRILFPFYYDAYKEQVMLQLRKLHLAIRNIGEFKDTEFEEKHNVVDFMGAQNFGGSSCWLAVYPKAKETHKNAWQLFMNIDSSGVEYGLCSGSNLRTDKGEYLRDTALIVNINEFSYKKMKEKYLEVYKAFKEKNGEGYIETVETPVDIEPPIGIHDNPVTVAEHNFQIKNVSFDNELNIDKLHFENIDILKVQIATALKNGKNIVLVGPPGTGKSKLAKEICRSYGADYKMTTATSDWSTYETIGGYRPKKDGQLEFKEGVFLSCYKDNTTKEPLNKWIIIDELNRADIDKAFGALFSALTGDEITLGFQADSDNNIIIRPQAEVEEAVEVNDFEYVVPRSWRIIGTMNTFDKASLYEMSYAFMRRFAFIPVGVPKHINESLIESYLKLWVIDDKSYNEVSLSKGLAMLWKIINKYRIVGPAIIEDMANYVSDKGDYTSAVILYVLPQFEGIMEDKIRQFVKELLEGEMGSLFKQKELLVDFVEDFFEIRL